LTHDSRKVRFGDISIRFPLQGGVKRFAFGVDDAYESSPFEGNFGNSERVSLVQEDFDRFAIRDWQGEKASVLKTGKRSGGWAMGTTPPNSRSPAIRSLCTSGRSMAFHSSSASVPQVTASIAGHTRTALSWTSSLASMSNRC
ncbi:MAG: hypothetical protein QF437_25795, partial [Planctomycetota bacterium]|nr:hypothetical protein [Planctomycetota bacterium]